MYNIIKVKRKLHQPHPHGVQCKADKLGVDPENMQVTVHVDDENAKAKIISIVTPPRIFFVRLVID